MTTFYNLIEEKAEDAFAAYIDAKKGSNLAGVTIVKGLEEDAGAFPALLIVGKRATPAYDAAPTLGNYVVEAEFTVISDMNSSTRDQHKAWVGCLSDMLMVDDLESGMTTAIAGKVADFVPDQWTPGARSRTINSAGRRVTTIQGELLCRSA